MGDFCLNIILPKIDGKTAITFVASLIGIGLGLYNLLQDRPRIFVDDVKSDKISGRLSMKFFLGNAGKLPTTIHEIVFYINKARTNDTAFYIRSIENMVTMSDTPLLKLKKEGFNFPTLLMPHTSMRIEALFLPEVTGKIASTVQMEIRHTKGVFKKTINIAEL